MGKGVRYTRKKNVIPSDCLQHPLEVPPASPEPARHPLDMPAHHSAFFSGFPSWASSSPQIAPRIPWKCRPHPLNPPAIPLICQLITAHFFLFYRTPSSSIRPPFALKLELDVKENY